MKTIKDKIKVFENAVNYCITYFNMEDCEFRLMETTNSSYRGACNYWKMSDYPFTDARTFTISYNLNWIKDKNVKKNEIETVAMHEVLEAWLSRIREYAENKTYLVSERDIDNEVHKIIRFFENKLKDKIFND